MIPLPWDVLGLLGSAVGNVITDAWITMMLGLWSGALWLLGLVMGFMDVTLQPDLRLEGPGRDLYMITFALGVSLAVILSTLQIGVALVRRDGRSIGRLLVGVGTFWLFLSGGITYAVVVLSAASALTRALMQSLFGVTTWRAFQPWEPFALEDVTDGVMATVLGMCSVFVLISAVVFFLVMVARAAALLVLATTSPIAAAGLVSDVGHTWLWRVVRWFHAAAFTPMVVVLVLGVGLKLSAGVAAGLADGVAASIGTAFASTVLIATASFAPLALFKLLAFVEPGTASGAAARAGWAAVGGLQGLIAGKQPGEGTTSTASASSPAGGSQGEAQAQTNTQNRLANALGSLNPTTSTAGLTGEGETGRQHPMAAGAAKARSMAATGLGAFTQLGAQGASVGADLTNQTGIGHNGYYPDAGGTPTSHRPHLTQPPTTPASQPVTNPGGGAPVRPPVAVPQVPLPLNPPTPEQTGEPR